MCPFPNVLDEQSSWMNNDVDELSSSDCTRNKLMNPNHACCEDTFSNVPLYLQHLKTHEDNTNIMIKCIICGQTCINWISFRKHNTRNHKDNNPLEIFDEFTVMVDDLIANDLNIF